MADNTKGEGPAPKADEKRTASRAKVGEKAKDPKKPAEPAAAKTSEFNDTVLAFLKNVQTSMKKQDEKLSKVVERMDEMDKALNESYQYDYPEEYDDFEPENANEDTEGLASSDEHACTSSKRKVDENNNSRFAGMSKRFKIQETCDKPIDETLASNVSEFFRSGIDEERFAELIKDENNARPENCEGLVTVRTNQMIWEGLSSVARTNDRKLQGIATSVVKAATILVKSVNAMAEKEKDDKKFGEEIDNCNEVLALLGHANRQINLTRRDFLKPEIKEEYMHLCNHNLPYTKELFGDDVSKTAKEIEDIAKVSSKIGLNRNRGRGFYMTRGQFRSRGRFRPYSRGRPFQHGHVAGRMESKNYSRRGPMKPGKY